VQCRILTVSVEGNVHHGSSLAASQPYGAQGFRC